MITEAALQLQWAELSSGPDGQSQRPELGFKKNKLGSVWGTAELAWAGVGKQSLILCQAPCGVRGDRVANPELNKPSGTLDPTRLRAEHQIMSTLRPCDTRKERGKQGRMNRRNDRACTCAPKQMQTEEET